MKLISRKLAQDLVRQKLQFLNMYGTVALRLFIRIFSDRELQTCSLRDS